MYLRSIARGGGSEWRIFAICSERHECDLLDFLHDLAPNLRKSGEQLLALFEQVAATGPRLLPDDVSHQIAPDIYQFEKGRLRVPWFYDEGRLIICCRAFVKKTQKTPRAEWEYAKSMRARYFEEKRLTRISILEEY